MLNTDLEFRYLMFKIFIAYIMNMCKCGECVTFQKWLVDSDRPWTFGISSNHIGVCEVKCEF